MNIFKRTQENEKKFNELTNKLEQICTQLGTYSKDLDISSIKHIKENFISKTNDFFREDRKLNIGVIGQVKAGKSSFLNTMIFDGMEVLPKASTPKTATLTKIEYSDKNFIEIEYYTIQEWKIIEEKSRIDSELNEYVVAKEIMNMVRENNISPYSYLERRTDTIEFSSYEDLMKEINNYVGEDGKLTPLVKSVKLNVNKKDLKEISIVDTPGLNDPIASRTDKTKQFIEMCDVVFFLSRASAFLDKSDVDLLTAQLPQKGVKRLVLICSRYDAGLTDTIYDKGGLKDADIDTKMRLKKNTKKIFDRIIEEYSNRNASKEFINIISQCKKPIFVSSMAHNMSNKSKEQYNGEEKTVYEGLNIYDEINEDVLRNIGNIKEVKNVFSEVINEKEETLIRRSSSFIPDTLQEVKNVLTIMKQTLEKRINLLSNNDKQQLINQKKYISNQINNINSSIEGIFGELYIKLEKSKAEALKDLRDGSREYLNLSERMGTETKLKSYTVSTSKWYNPFTWGTSRTEYYSYEERYYYLDASDALENIRNFGNDSVNTIEHMFYKSIDTANLKKKLLNIIVENFDASDENYDPAYFKLLAEKTLNNIELPVVKIDISKYLNTITAKFSGEIKNSLDKSSLKTVLANSLSQLLGEISERFIEELISFKEEIEIIKDNFSNNLLENINKEFNIVIEQFENKEKEIERAKGIITDIDRIIGEIVL